MTDLDRQIAELKGLRIACIFGNTDFGAVGMDLEIIPGSGSFERVDCWSTSDAKAFELVDEWCAMAKGNAVWISVDATITRASFIRDYSPHAGGILVSAFFGSTRPEAICRAYIAAKEWERKNQQPKGGD